jgi:hypothetical protein
MPDIDDLGVIRELLAASPPSRQVNDHVRARLNAVIAAAEPDPGARRLWRRTPGSRHTVAVAEGRRRRPALRTAAGEAAVQDQDLITAVRASAADGHSASPVRQIISRGRSVRARRRIPIMAGALAAAACVALVVTALLPSGHPGQGSRDAGSGRHASARLTAWTVARQANGDIDITISQLRDPAGLQSTLRADRLAASVTFSDGSASVSSRSASCQPYLASADVVNAVAQWTTNDHSAFLVINPSALPGGTGVAIFDVPGAQLPTPSQAPGRVGSGSGTLLIPAPAGWSTGPLAVGLVYASRQCTG